MTPGDAGPAGGLIGPGSRVRVHFTLTLADGTAVDTSRDGEPLELTLGDGTLDPGLERCLLGLAAGDAVRRDLAPGEAFGMRDPEAVHRVGRGEFPAGMALAPGTVVEFTAPSGLALAGTVLALEDESVQVDFSHPLAGRPLVFEVEVLAVERR